MTDNRSLLTRTTAEIGPDNAVDDILDSPTDLSAYVGFEPSGELHIGHLVVAQKMIDLQKLGIDVTILLADIHAALNGKGTIAEIQKTGEKMIDEFISFGLDRDQTSFVFGSDFQSDLDYQLSVQELSQNVSLNRARRSMSDIGHNQEKVSNVLYPVMQVVDIHHLGVDIAVGGMEQRKVHMLARDTLPKIEAEKPMFIHTPLIEDLGGDDSKMSTSTGISISTSATEDEIRTQISDSFCPPAVVQDGRQNPIIQIAEYLLLPRQDILEISRKEEYGGDVTFTNSEEIKKAVDEGSLHPTDLKQAVSDGLVQMLCRSPKD